MTLSPPPLRVLVVDDHPMVRAGLRSMLTGDEVEVVAEAGSGAEAVERAVALGPDLVLLDVELPDVDGLETLTRLKARVPDTAVLMVSMHDDASIVRRAVEAGAAGYVLKGIGRRELLAAVRAVREGGSVLDPALLRSLAAPASRDAAEPAAAAPLTRVELEALALLAAGLTNREIAERLRWSVGTVKKYVQRILEKLDVSDRTQAAVVAVRRGLL
ncbi:MAG TPA: response regulator transcription factor [Candidatus Acidoferrum sp.]|nr:response regulator transcription factor [Candidatus Acidoferrum sp.]